jgi:1,4-alpha-glucan branching enzyme
MRPLRRPAHAPAPDLLGSDDLHLFNQGRHFALYEKLGAQLAAGGAHFTVWAPDAEAVSVVGTFNGWDPRRTPLAPRGRSGLWSGFAPDVVAGALYKYHIVTRGGRLRADKGDPFGFYFEEAPRTASIVWHLDYNWHDAAWMAERRERQGLASPLSIYEVHLGSWMRVPEEGNRALGYRELAPKLAAHVRSLGFTHVELLPVMEHPFYGSWGYQTTGYFAPTSRYGIPQDFMFLVDYLHQNGIGVILDWVPSHFPSDAHALANFDGTHLYEHADPRRGFHPDWNSLIFNYGRDEVRSFLISNALFWLDKYHADGLRVDAVASMLYLDYSRRPGEWLPNEFGGRENLEAIHFLRELNQAVYARFPDVQTFAEESTAWPGVSRPTYTGGLGFGYKWDMGWMHDTLAYFARDPVHRKHHHNELTFRNMYAFSENFVLPLSHDEVVHGKGSLLAKMAGDTWQKFANLRLLLAYQYAQPGKKLLFMGAELAGWREWNHDARLEWHLAEQAPHQGVGRLIGDLNRLYRRERALHAQDADPAGFQWLEAGDAENGVIAFLRRAPGGRPVVVAGNFTPVVRRNYRLGVPQQGRWQELLNSDAARYGGSDVGNLGETETHPAPAHGHAQSLTLTLPPLALLFFAPPEEPV